MTHERPIEERIDEVVIGLADDAGVAEIERLAASDAAVAAMLEKARSRFAALDATAAPEPLPDDMWKRVSDKLGSALAQDSSRVGENGNVVSIERKPASRRMLWTAAIGLAACLLLAVTVGWSMLWPTEAYIIAVLNDDQGEAVALVEGSVDNATQITLLRPVNVPDGRVMQVWTKPEAVGVMSLGLMQRAQKTRLDAEGLPVPAAGQLYEITFEPEGGSPTGLPTGPIYGKGLAQRPL